MKRKNNLCFEVSRGIYFVIARVGKRFQNVLHNMLNSYDTRTVVFKNK